MIQEAGAVRECCPCGRPTYPIIVLLDTGDDPRGDFPLMRKAVAHFITRIGQRPVALGTFGTQPVMLTSFEDERETVLARLEELTAEEGAPSLLMQGAALAGETMKSTGSLFSAIVAVSATAEDASDLTMEDVAAPIVDSGAALHVLRQPSGRSGSGAPDAASRRARFWPGRRTGVHDDLLGRLVPGRPRSAGRSPDPVR